MCDTNILTYLENHSHNETASPMAIVKIETLYHEYLNTARWRQIIVLTLVIATNTILISFNQLIGRQFLPVLVFLNIGLAMILLAAMKKIKRPLLVEILINNRIQFIELKQINNLNLKSSIMRIILTEVMNKRINKCMPGENYYDRYF